MRLPRSVGIIDYGFGNVTSVVNALSEVGLKPIVATTGPEIEKEDFLLLPGVGAFPSAMRVVKQRGLDDAIHLAISRGSRILGICLGMQLLFQRGHEFEEHAGLGVLEGQVRPIVPEGKRSAHSKATHIAWKTVSPVGDGPLSKWFDSRRSPFYFVHTFAAHPENLEAVAGIAGYSGSTFVAAVERDNVAGVQFHPERSGENGLRFLSDFFLRS